MMNLREDATAGQDAYFHLMRTGEATLEGIQTIAAPSEIR